MLEHNESLDGTRPPGEFKSFPKIPRLNREAIISEKINGTNAQIYIDPDTGAFLCGSRRRYITPGDDNFGFAAWAHENRGELQRGLGPGRHFGEWWGSGIQCGMGKTGGERIFSLFNSRRWIPRFDPGDEHSQSRDHGFGHGPGKRFANPHDGRPQEMVPRVPGLTVVPVLMEGRLFSQNDCTMAMRSLSHSGSVASPGYLNPEGVVVYHIASGSCFKITFANDGVPKSTLLSHAPPPRSI